MEDNQEFIPPTDATAVESAVEDVQFIPPTDATAVEEITDPDVKKKSRPNRLRTLLYSVLEVFRKNLHHLLQLV